MQFLTPIYLGLLLFLAAVILFYLFRKQYDKQVVPSTYLWSQVMREWQATKWWRVLQRHVLLYLQLLILALLMLALMRPFIGMNKLSGEHIVVVLDTSASMTALEEDKTRLQLAKDAINDDLIKQLKNQKMTVIAAESLPNILFSTETNKAVMQKAILEVQPSYQTTDITAAVMLANQLLTGSTGEIHVFSDRTDREHINDVYLQYPVTVHNIGTSRTNVSIHAFGVALTEGKVNGMLSLYNEMETDQQVTVKIEYNGEKISDIKEVVKPNELKQVYIHDLPEHPFYKAVIMNEDNYKFDNVEFAFLAVDKEPSLFLVGDINPFISKALEFLSTDIIQIENETDIPAVDNALYILGGVSPEYWPSGPSLILSPTEGGPFKVKEKKELKSELRTNDDPLMQFVAMDEVYIQKNYPFDSSQLQSIVANEEGAIISKGYYEGHPLVMLGFDVEDTDWPMHASFPIFLYNTINYLTEQQTMIGYLRPNERKEIAYSTDATKSLIYNEADEEILELNTGDAFLYAPHVPGLYRMKESTPYGERERLFVVVLDEEEKFISPNKSFALEIENARSSEIRQENPNEIWVWLTVIAILFLILEWEVYRRGVKN